MDSFDQNYDHETLKTFTSQEIEGLKALHRKLDSKQHEILNACARQLGLEVSDARVEELATEVIDNWEEGPAMDIKPQTDAADGLPRLLMERHEISELIMDIRDEAFEREMRKDAGEPDT